METYKTLTTDICSIKWRKTSHRPVQTVAAQLCLNRRYEKPIESDRVWKTVIDTF